MLRSNYGPFVSLRGTFDWVRRRYLFMIASLASYVVVFPLVMLYVADTNPTAFTGFVGLDAATYRLTVAVVAALSLGFVALNLRRGKRLFDVDALADDPSIDGDAALAERLRQSVILQFVLANSIGTLAVVLWLANGGIVIPLAFLAASFGLMIFNRPRWEDWADVRAALRGRRAGWVGEAGGS